MSEGGDSRSSAAPDKIEVKEEDSKIEPTHSDREIDPKVQEAGKDTVEDSAKIEGEDSKIDTESKIESEPSESKPLTKARKVSHSSMDTDDSEEEGGLEFGDDDMDLDDLDDLDEEEGDPEDGDPENIDIDEDVVSGVDGDKDGGDTKATENDVSKDTDDVGGVDKTSNADGDNNGDIKVKDNVADVTTDELGTGDKTTTESDVKPKPKDADVVVGEVDSNANQGDSKTKRKTGKADRKEATRQDSSSSDDKYEDAEEELPDKEEGENNTVDSEAKPADEDKDIAVTDAKSAAPENPASDGNIDGDVKQEEEPKDKESDATVTNTKTGAENKETSATTSDTSSTNTVAAKKDPNLAGKKEADVAGSKAGAKAGSGKDGEASGHGDDAHVVGIFGGLADQAEAKTANNKATKREAREIRMRERERAQKEMEDKQDRIYEITSNSTTTSSRRRGSDDSATSDDTRELKKNLEEMTDKYNKAMSKIADLLNQKDHFKFEKNKIAEDLYDLKEELTEEKRQRKDRQRDLDQKRRDYNDLQQENEFHKKQIEQMNALIQEYNLVFVNNEIDEAAEEKKKGKRRKKKEPAQVEGTAALVTRDALEILGKHEGNLDERLKLLDEAQQLLSEENKRLKQSLEEEREKNEMAEKYSPKRDSSKHSSNGPTEMALMEVQIETSKQIAELRFENSKLRNEITTLQGANDRLQLCDERHQKEARSAEEQVKELKKTNRALKLQVNDLEHKLLEEQQSIDALRKRVEKLRQRDRT